MRVPATLKEWLLMLAVWAILGWVAYALLTPMVSSREAACRSSCAETTSDYHYQPPKRTRPVELCECTKPGDRR